MATAAQRAIFASQRTRSARSTRYFTDLEEKASLVNSEEYKHRAPRVRKTGAHHKNKLQLTKSPKELFQLHGLFQQPRVSRIYSHELSEEELPRLSKAFGCMPNVVSVPVSYCPIAKIRERVDVLDDQLRERVQSICDQFKGKNVLDGPSWCRACRRQTWSSLFKFCRLGVLKDIWPEIMFYLLYTICLQLYASIYDWEFQWAATNQDTIYYPAIVMSFLLSFRASDCMARYQVGCQCIFEMQKQLRELAFEVMTRLTLDGHSNKACPIADTAQSRSQAVKKRYFKHEFRRLAQALFTCACRDLNDSDGSHEATNEELLRLRCSLTDVEQAAIHVTHSSHGHVFRIYLVASWLAKLVQGAQLENLFDDDYVHLQAEEKLSEFKQAWMKARQVAYSAMPLSVTHLLWVLATTLNFVLPWEYVSVCQWFTWLPSIFISVSFFGIVKIAASMENPFGFDEDDIPIWEVAEHLDEEVCLIMFYAALDEVGGENLYRGLAAQDRIYLA